MTLKKIVTNLFIFTCCLTLSANALPLAPEPAMYTLKVNSAKPQSFFGTYLTNEGLRYIDSKTPYEIKFNATEVRIMLGTDRTKSLISVELLKQHINDPNPASPAASATGYSIYMCNSNVIQNKKSTCEVSVQANK